MSFSIARRFLSSLTVVLVGATGLVGCSGSSSSAGVTASPGSVPRSGQVVATAALSSEDQEASRCGGVDDAVRDALKAAAYERGWVINRFSADGEGCWASAELASHGQVVRLALDADQGSSTASLRVKGITPSSPSSAPGAEEKGQS